MDFPLQSPNYGKITTLIKSIIVNTDKEILLSHRQNSAWILEYCSIYFAQRGYEMYVSEWTVLRMFKKYLEYTFDVLPVLYDIQHREGWSTATLATYLGYKNKMALHNGCNPKHIKSWIMGYNSTRQAIVKASKTAG